MSLAGSNRPSTPSVLLIANRLTVFAARSPSPCRTSLARTTGARRLPRKLTNDRRTGSGAKARYACTTGAKAHSSASRLRPSTARLTGSSGSGGSCARAPPPATTRATSPSAAPSRPRATPTRSAGAVSRTATITLPLRQHAGPSRRSAEHDPARSAAPRPSRAPLTNDGCSVSDEAGRRFPQPARPDVGHRHATVERTTRSLIPARSVPSPSATTSIIGPRHSLSRRGVRRG